MHAHLFNFVVVSYDSATATSPCLPLLRMFIPYPTWFFPIFGPFPLRVLVEDTKSETGTIISHFGDIHNLRSIPIWRVRDKTLRSAYRLYELMGWEAEYFLFRRD